MSAEVRDLGERTHEAMLRGVRAVAPGRPISVIGRVIESYARRFGYGVVRDYTGHGVGPSFHTRPTILHYDEPRATTVMEPGMTFTIEPMLTLGGVDWLMWDDGWTVLTRDGSWAAQWEHTLVVTDDGAEILTLPVAGSSTAYGLSAHRCRRRNVISAVERWQRRGRPQIGDRRPGPILDAAAAATELGGDRLAIDLGRPNSSHAGATNGRAARTALTRGHAKDSSSPRPGEAVARRDP